MQRCSDGVVGHGWFRTGRSLDLKTGETDWGFGEQEERGAEDLWWEKEVRSGVLIDPNGN